MRILAIVFSLLTIALAQQPLGEKPVLSGTIENYKGPAANIEVALMGFNNSTIGRIPLGKIEASGAFSIPLDSVAPQVLTRFEGCPGLKSSVSEFRGIKLQLFSQSQRLHLSNFINPGELPYGQSELWYVDRDVKLEGACKGLTGEVSFNMTLNKGWNWVGLDYTTSVMSPSAARTADLSGFKWYLGVVR